MDSNLKSAIIGAIIGAILGSILTVSAPYVVNFFWGNSPDVFIFMYGMENSSTVEPLPNGNLSVPSPAIVALKLPEGYNISDNYLPVKYFKWEYPPNYKYYVLHVVNKGDGIARKIKVDLNLMPSQIRQIKLNEDRVKVVEGGENSSGVKFVVDELLPGESQIIEIVAWGKILRSLSGWEESEKEIKKIVIGEISFNFDVTHASEYASCKPQPVGFHVD